MFTKARVAISAAALCAATGALAQVSDIVGGKPAPAGRYPGMVGLVQSKMAVDHEAFWCGATLVSPQDVVTAAHCLEGFADLVRDFQVLVGTTELSDTAQSQGRRIALSRVTVHPLRKQGVMNYDIAVLRLAEPVTDVRPMHFIDNLADEARIAPDDKPVAVTGWGSTRPVYFEPGNISPVLKEAKVRMVNWDQCNKSPYYKGYLTENMVCAGWPAGGQDICPGDSGGPLIARNAKAPGGYSQIGITSWMTTTCGTAGRPAVYARLAKLGPWLRAEIAKP